MSRIGKAVISIPAGVEVAIDGAEIRTKGPKGELALTMPDGISASADGTVLQVARAGEEREVRALHGLVRSLVNNMVTGVSQGFRKDLEIIGVGYRCAAKGPDALELQLGYSHPVVYKAPAGITFEVLDQQKISVNGIDKQLVGQVAAEIRRFRKPEPYKGKGIRYAGEKVIRKAGKARSRNDAWQPKAAGPPGIAAISVPAQGRGTAERPRLSVFRSNKHISGASHQRRRRSHVGRASSPRPRFVEEATGNAVCATKVGALVAERAKAAGIPRSCSTEAGTSITVVLPRWLRPHVKRAWSSEAETRSYKRADDDLSVDRATRELVTIE